MNRRFHLLFWYAYLVGHIAFGQLTPTFISKSYSSDARLLTIVVKPIFGNDSISLITLFGEESPTNKPDTTSFFIEYENIPSEKIIKGVPASVGIENLSKTVYQMPIPVYSPDDIDKNSTKTWQISFAGIPEYAGCVKINIAGTIFEIGDLPSAENSRQVRLDNFIVERKKRAFSLSEINPAHQDSLLSTVKKFVIDYVKKDPNTNYFGKMTWLVDSLGVNKFTLLDDTSKIEPLESALKEKFSSLKLPIELKYGMPVNYKSEFAIFLSSGIANVNNSKSKARYTPEIYSDEIKSFIKKNLPEKARYKAVYNYGSLNGQKLEISKIKTTKTFLNREQQNIFIFSTLAALGIVLAALTVL